MTDQENLPITRRRVLAGSIVALGGLAWAGARAAAQEKPAKTGDVITVNAQENYWSPLRKYLR